jgi:NADH-quinone oxidoreductase subunit I
MIQAILLWLRNIKTVVLTVVEAMRVSLLYWWRTYDPKQRTYTEHFEYPELPLAAAPRFRGFHRYDLTSCIACEACSRACPASCIAIGKQKAPTGKGFQVTSFKIDYGKCLFCALCIEPCPVDCIFMGASHDLSCYRPDGCVVDFSRLPVEIAWGRASLEPLAVAQAKKVMRPVHGGPNQ